MYGPEVRLLGRISAGKPQNRSSGQRSAGRRPILRLSLLRSGRHAARKPDCWPGGTIVQHTVHLAAFDILPAVVRASARVWALGISGRAFGRPQSISREPNRSWPVAGI